MSNLDYLIMIIVSIISITIELLVFAKLSGNKLIISRKNVLIIVVFGILLTLNIYTNGAILRAILSFLLSLMIMYLIFGTNIRKTVFYTIIIYIFISIIEILMSLLLLKLNIDLQIFDTSVIIKGVFSFVNSGLVYLVSCIKYIRKYINVIVNKLSHSTILITAFLTALIILVVSDFKYIMTISTKIYIGNIVLLFCLVFILIVIIYNNFRIAKETEKSDILLNYMSNYEKVIDKDRINRHEMLNNLLSLKAIENKNSKEFENILNELIETYSSNKVGIKNMHKLPTGLKGLLYYKLLGLEEKGFNININISKQLSNTFKTLNNNEYIVLCRVVGILLDNAVESASESKNKYISFEIFKEDNNVVIMIDNSFKGKVDLSRIDNKYYSTKGKGRGLGLYLINDLLARINSISIERSIDKNIFSTKLIINKK